MKYLIPPLVLFGLTVMVNNASAQFYISDAATDSVDYLSSSGTLSAYATNSALTDAVAITEDSAGDVYVAIGNGGAAVDPDTIQEIAAGTGTVSTFATIPNVFGGGVNPTGLTYYNGNVYSLDAGNNTIVEYSPDGTSSSTFGYATYSFGLGVNPANGTILTDGYGGSYSGELDSVKQPSGTLTIAQRSAVIASNLNNNGGTPGGVAVSPVDGNYYVVMGGASSGGTKILKITPTGTVSTFVTLAPSNAPVALAFNAAGDLFTVDQASNNKILEYSTTGTLLASYPTNLGSGSFPTGIVFDSTSLSSTPEPSTWALLMAGCLFLVGSTIWRRKVSL